MHSNTKCHQDTETDSGIHDRPNAQWDVHANFVNDVVVVVVVVGAEGAIGAAAAAAATVAVVPFSKFFHCQTHQ